MFVVQIAACGISPDHRYRVIHWLYLDYTLIAKGSVFKESSRRISIVSNCRANLAGTCLPKTALYCLCWHGWDTGVGYVGSVLGLLHRPCMGLIWFIGSPNLVFCNKLYLIWGPLVDIAKRTELFGICCSFG